MTVGTTTLVDPGVAVGICSAGTCTRLAQPEHTPCCNSQIHGGRGLCCLHYCRFHFVERDPCSPERHAVAPVPS